MERKRYPSRHHRLVPIDGFRFALPILRRLIALNGTNFTLFLLAALVIAAVPGPGIFYVAARTLSGGKRAGIASTFGTALGGLVHVIAGGLGVSAIILASAELFTALKFAGALYLVWLGFKTFREARDLLPQQAIASRYTAGVSGRRAGRSPEPEDRRFLSGLHSAIRRPGRRLRRAPVHHARPDLGGAQYAGRCRRGDDGRDGAHRSRAPAAFASTIATGLGAVHRRPRYFAGAGAAARS